MFFVEMMTKCYENPRRSFIFCLFATKSKTLPAAPSVFITDFAGLARFSLIPSTSSCMTMAIFTLTTRTNTLVFHTVITNRTYCFAASSFWISLGPWLAGNPSIPSTTYRIDAITIPTWRAGGFVKCFAFAFVFLFAFAFE